jgi:hypothetical protein
MFRLAQFPGLIEIQKVSGPVVPMAVAAARDLRFESAKSRRGAVKATSSILTMSRASHFRREASYKGGVAAGHPGVTSFEKSF